MASSRDPVRDVLRIDYHVEAFPAGDEECLLIVPRVFVNRRNLLEDCTLDLRELVMSTRVEGECWLLICGCGTQGCGVDRPVEVSHCGESVRWEVPESLRSRSTTGAVRTYSFDRATYVATVAAALLQAQNLAQQSGSASEIGPHGFEIEELLGLDPVPSP